ncbi:hypothetical protein GCM10020366_69330 [Saccharopolyspora gregorii]|uniref:ABC transporter permease n=2 Tax=Saccharopolyspora gregorii TaxID=33914 RepID=A0ABP6S2F3_9PSEU
MTRMNSTPAEQPWTTLLAQEVRPAGGAALDQIFIASGGATALTLLLLLLGYGHRTGRTQVLARLAERSQRVLPAGLPGWVALPQLLAMISLLTALLGMYWDISLHITHGRDEGPLANVAHYPILIGLFGLFAAGMLAVVLPKGEPVGRAAVRITRDWHAPISGVLLAGAGFYALLGFPLDDVWHRIFGQDVTLWGPTHLMLIGGAGLSLVAVVLLEREGRLARTDLGEPRALARFAHRGMAVGGLLVGLSVFQAEFDYGVQQFRMVHQPFMIAVATGCALVVARLWAGRGAALFAVGFYVLVRGGVAVFVGPIIGEEFATIPLHLVEALCVELAAVFLVRRPLVLGAVSGLLIGTVGYASEYAWTQVAFPLPWSPDMAVEGAVMAVAGGVPGGVLGALLALALRGAPPKPKVSAPLFGGALVVIALAVTNALIGTAPPVRADVTLTDVRGGPQDRTAQAVIRMSPPGTGQDATWLTTTGWQGGGLHVDRLVPIGPDTYRTTRPMPLHGTWKTMIRFHQGRAQVAIPVYMPSDTAIGLPAVPADAQFSRDSQPEWQVLQRETKQDVPSWLWVVASLVVLACSLALVLSLGWGAHRIGRVGADRPEAIEPEAVEPGATESGAAAERAAR